VAPWELAATVVAVGHPHLVAEQELVVVVVVVFVEGLVAVGLPWLAAVALLHLKIAVVAKPVPLRAVQVPDVVVQDVAVAEQELAGAAVQGFVASVAETKLAADIVLAD